MQGGCLSARPPFPFSAWHQALHGASCLSILLFRGLGSQALEWEVAYDAVAHVTLLAGALADAATGGAVSKRTAASVVGVTSVGTCDGISTMVRTPLCVATGVHVTR